MCIETVRSVSIYHRATTEPSVLIYLETAQNHWRDLTMRHGHMVSWGGWFMGFLKMGIIYQLGESLGGSQANENLVLW